MTNDECRTTARSHAIFQRALQLMPGGVNSPARAFGAVGGEPIVIERGAGAYLWDVDGNQYIDYVGSWGPLILGHAYPAVVEAVAQAARRGTSFGAPTATENELAELIIEAVPSIEKVRLVSSGTEATMSAIRLARGFTGRDVIVKFAGNYHGHVDCLLVAAGSSAATLAVPNSPGVTVGTSRDTLVLQYNDVAGLRAAFTSHGSRIAGVIFEPVVGNMGVVVPSREFLVALRDVTRQHGALLICDEVMTGFRVAYGGAQQLLEIDPDITTLGKIVGGGLPVGAYGGRADVMDHVLPAGKVFQAGTLSGNPLATAAGCAMLRALRDDPPYERLEILSHRLEVGLREAAQAAGVAHQLARVGSMLTLFFTELPVIDWPTASRCDTTRFANYFWGMLDRGVYLPCSQFEALFVSAAHTEDDIDATVVAARDALSSNHTKHRKEYAMSDPIKLYDEADKLKDAGKLDEAVAKFKEALGVDPNYALAHSALAVVLQKLGRHDEAIAHARKVCEIEPNDPFSFTALSVTYQRAYAGTNNLGYIRMAEDAMEQSRILQSRR